MMAIDKICSEINLTPNVLADKKSQSTKKWNFIKKLAVRHFLQSLQNNEPKIFSSENIAYLLFPDRNSVHYGRLIRHCAQYFVHKGMLPEHNQGKFVKTNRGSTILFLQISLGCVLGAFRCERSTDPNA